MNDQTLEPQSICTPITRSAMFIVATLTPASEAASTVRDWCDMRSIIDFVDGTENPL